MTSKLKMWVGGAALAGAAVMSVAAWAMGPPGGMEPDPTQMMAQMGKKLDLSAEQQSEVEGLLASAKQASAADQKRMHELRVEMKGMRDNFDAEKARKLADEIGKVTGRLVYQASATWSGVYQLLNAEQKAELDSMMAQRGERHGKWREGGERPSQ